MADRECVVLFSGGRDSSLACLEMARKEFDLHLLTFNNGAIMNINYSDYRYGELVKLMPNRIKSRLLLSSFGLFKEIALMNIEEDFKKYKTNMICLGCKLAMHVLSLVYCIKNDVKLITDGYTEYQKKYMEQSPEIINEVKKLHSEFGVEYLNPVYHVRDKAEVKRRLLIAGMSPKSMEGTCLFGDTFSTPKSEAAIRYMKEKSEVCRSYINDYIKNGRLLPIIDLKQLSGENGNGAIDH